MAKILRNMVTKIGFPLSQTVFSPIKNCSTVTKIALAVLALASSIGLYLYLRWPTTKKEHQSLEDLQRRRTQEELQNGTIELEAQPQGIQFHSNGYPINLVNVLKEERINFEKIPILLVNDTHLQQTEFNPEGKNPYLKIAPTEMRSSIMKGQDVFQRLFLAFRYRQKKTGDEKVDIFLCRDPDHNRWYLNDEASPETFTRGAGQSLSFLKLLIQDKHPIYQLA